MEDETGRGRSRLERFHDRTLDVLAASACVLVVVAAILLYVNATRGSATFGGLSIIVAMVDVPVALLSAGALVASNLLIAYKES